MLRRALLALVWAVPGLSFAAPPASLRDFLHQQHQLQCERRFRCCGAGASRMRPFPPDVDGCVVILDAAIDEPGSADADEEQKIAQGTWRFEAAAADACLSRLAVQAPVCDGTGDADPACAPVVVATSQEGAACDPNQLDGCAAGLYCPKPPGWDDNDLSTQHPSQCAPLRGQGEACNSSDFAPCGEGLRCPKPPGWSYDDPATHTATACEPYRKLGEACLEAAECGPFHQGNTCRSDTHACGPYLQPGERCLLSFECQLTLCDHQQGVCPVPQTVREQLCTEPFTRTGGGLASCSSAGVSGAALLFAGLLLRRRRRA
jgi:hypothetical protein